MKWKLTRLLSYCFLHNKDPITNTISHLLVTLVELRLRVLTVIVYFFEKESLSTSFQSLRGYCPFGIAEPKPGLEPLLPVTIVIKVGGVPNRLLVCIAAKKEQPKSPKIREIVEHH